MKPGVFLLFLFFTRVAAAQNNDAVQNYISTYRRIAIAEMQRTGVPAAIKLAQGIHETQAGTSELVRKSNNHFGIKCKNTWTGDKVYHDDDARGECFRSYSAPEDSYRDHSDFLKNSPRYAFLFQLDPTDYKAWAAGLRKAGYATNYRYAQIIVKLIEDYNLEQYTLIAMGKLPPLPDQALLAAAPDANTSSTIISAVAATGISSQQAGTETLAPPHPEYPNGEFRINDTRVVFVKGGTALLTVAEEYHVSFAHLLDFNDLDNGDILATDQLIYLQRKRKSGANEFHTVQPSEDCYYISQAEGIRLENLLANNLLDAHMQPAIGEKLYLQNQAAARPLLAEEKKALMSEAVVDTHARPIDTTHVVQTRETLYSISRKYGVSPEQLKSWNKLDTANLKVGQQLVIHAN